MKIVKTYDDFINEEINLRKGLIGAALGAGLALSNPSIASGIENIPKMEIEQENTSIDGWGKVKWGMTKDEVMVEYPEAKEGGCVSVIKASLNMSVPQFGISNYEISGKKYNIAFLFKDDKLNGVNLELKEISPSIYFDELKEKLIEKYNKEISISDNNNKKTFKWILNNGTVELNLNKESSSSDERLIIYYRKIEESGF